MSFETIKDCIEFNREQRENQEIIDCPVCAWTLDEHNGVKHCILCGWSNK